MGVSQFISTPKIQFNNDKFYNWHCEFYSRKLNFWTLFPQELFESIDINLTETTLAAVIFGFSTLSGTNPQM